MILGVNRILLVCKMFLYLIYIRRYLKYLKELCRRVDIKIKVKAWELEHF